MKFIYISILLIIFSTNINSQPWMNEPYLTISNVADSSKLKNFYEIQRAFELYEKDMESELNKRNVSFPDANFGKEGKFPGYAQFKRWEWYMQSRVFPSGDITLPSTNYNEFEKYLKTDNYLRFELQNDKNKYNENKLQSFSGNWAPLGPTGNHMGGEFFGGAARVNFLKFDPTNSNIMWTGSPTGGLWKSTDSGLNWTTNTDQLTILGCSDIAINPKNTQIMYLATGDGDGTGSQLNIGSIGILKSTNGGDTWGLNTMNWQVSWGRNIYKLLINPNNPDTIFSATSVGIYRTTNAGTNWIQVQSGQFTHIEYKPGSTKVVYAVAGVFSNGMFYKSTDGGTSFVQVTSGLPLSSNVARLKIGVTPADSNLVYVVAVKKTTNDFYGFYRSTDGGDNFTLQSNSPNILFGLAGSQAWYNLSMAVSPFHKDTIIVGATDCFRSTDGGITWAKHTSNGIGAPLVHPDHHALEYLPGNDSTYFSGNDGGVWKTTNWGKNWTTLNEGLQIAQIYKLGTSNLNPYTILTGHQDMGTHIFKGGNWGIFTGNTGDGMECIFDRDSDTIMYLESQNGIIMKTLNTYPLFDWVCRSNGNGVNAAGGWITPFIMHPFNDSILLVGKSQVWRTTNCGVSFSQVGNVSGGGTYLIALAYAPSNPNFIYAAKSNKLFVTVDGSSFVDRTIGLPVANASITSIVVSNIEPTKLWVTFSGYSNGNKVWMSSDTGRTWVNYSTGLPNLPVNCIVYQNNTNDALYIGTDVGVYYINDTISSWQPFFNGLPNVDVQELEIAYSINKIRAATNGRGLWDSDLMFNSSFAGSHSIILKSGWNMISSNLKPNNDSIIDVMKLVKNNLSIMKNGMGNTYIPSFDIDNIKKWNYQHGYQLYQTKLDTLNIIGTQLKPDTVNMILNSGWNLISYLRNTDYSPVFALSSLTDKNSLVICKDGNGKNYIPQFNINTIGAMKPGYGYQIYMKQKDTLIYPLNSGGKIAFDEITQLPKRLKSVVENTGNNSTIVLKINTKDLNEIGIRNSRGGLIGSGVVQNGISAITIWGYDEFDPESYGSKNGEILSAELYDYESNSIKSLDVLSIEAVVGSKLQNTLVYQKDAVLIVNTDFSTSKTKDKTMDDIQFSISPNPVRFESIINYLVTKSGKVNLTLFDLAGRKVRILLDEYKNVGFYELKLNPEELSNGQYSLILENDEAKISINVIIQK